MSWEDKPFDDSFGTALERGWSLDFTNTMALWLIGAHAVTGGLEIEANLMDRARQVVNDERPVRYLGAALFMLWGSGFDIAGRVSAKVARRDQLTVATVKIAQPMRHYVNHEPKITAATDMALAQMWVHGGPMPCQSLGSSFQDPADSSGSKVLTEENLDFLWLKRWQLLCGGWRLADNEHFQAGWAYIREAGLLGARGLTTEGREVMEGFGGSSAAYRRYLREGKKMSSGGNITTNIHTGGGAAVVGNTGNLSGGTINQSVTEPPTFTSDSDALKKLHEILKGLPGDEHDDDLTEAGVLKKAAESNGGSLPDEEHRGRAKALWGRIAGAVGKAAPEVISKTLADFFTKFMTGA